VDLGSVSGGDLQIKNTVLRLDRGRGKKYNQEEQALFHRGLIGKFRRVLKEEPKPFQW